MKILFYSCSGKQSSKKIHNVSGPTSRERYKFYENWHFFNDKLNSNYSVQSPISGAETESTKFSANETRDNTPMIMNKGKVFMIIIFFNIEYYTFERAK